MHETVKARLVSPHPEGVACEAATDINIYDDADIKDFLSAPTRAGIMLPSDTHDARRGKHHPRDKERRERPRKKQGRVKSKLNLTRARRKFDSTLGYPGEGPTDVPKGFGRCTDVHGLGYKHYHNHSYIAAQRRLAEATARAKAAQEKKKDLEPRVRVPVPCTLLGEVTRENPGGIICPVYIDTGVVHYHKIGQDGGVDIKSFVNNSPLEEELQAMRERKLGEEDASAEMDDEEEEDLTNTTPEMGVVPRSPSHVFPAQPPFREVWVPRARTPSSPCELAIPPAPDHKHVATPATVPFVEVSNLRPPMKARTSVPAHIVQEMKILPPPPQPTQAEVEAVMRNLNRGTEVTSSPPNSPVDEEQETDDSSTAASDEEVPSASNTDDEERSEDEESNSSPPGSSSSESESDSEADDPLVPQPPVPLFFHGVKHFTEAYVYENRLLFFNAQNELLKFSKAAYGKRLGKDGNDPYTLDDVFRLRREELFCSDRKSHQSYDSFPSQMAYYAGVWLRTRWLQRLCAFAAFSFEAVAMVKGYRPPLRCRIPFHMSVAAALLVSNPFTRLVTMRNSNVNRRGMYGTTLARTIGVLGYGAPGLSAPNSSHKYGDLFCRLGLDAVITCEYSPFLVTLFGTEHFRTVTVYNTKSALNHTCVGQYDRIFKTQFPFLYQVVQLASVNTPGIYDASLLKLLNKEILSAGASYSTIDSVTNESINFHNGSPGTPDRGTHTR